MANLTADLPLASSSRRIIDPGSDGPSWLQGLASGAAKAVNAIGGVMDENEARTRRSRAEEAAAREAMAREGAADVAFDHAMGRGAFAPETGAAPNMEPIQTPFDSELEGAPPPADVVNSVDEARRARAAEEQGRAPSGSSRIILERALSRLMAEYPDQTANILKEFRENGFYHYLMRERDTEEALYDAEVAGTIKQRQDYANIANAAGAALPGTTMNDQAAIGQIVARQEYLLKQQREAAAEARAAAAEGRTQQNFNQENTDREVTANFLAGMSASLTPSFNALKNLFTQANGDQSVLQLIPDTLNSLDIVANNYITAAMQNDAPPETIAAMRQQWQTLRPQIVELVSGPGSELGVASAVLEGMQRDLGINMMQALPVMSAMKEMFGMAGLEAAFGENPATSLPQEIKDSIRREISGIQGAIDTTGERVTMATVARLLRGDLNITEMDERQARTALPALVMSARGHVNAIRQGGGNVGAYVNANLQIANAAIEVQGGNSNAQTEMIVAGNVYTNEARAADVALMGREPDQARVMIEAKRATAQHMLQNINNASWRNHPSDTRNGLWTVQYVNGRYQTVVTDQTYQRWVRSEYANGRSNQLISFNGGTRVPTIEEVRRQGAPRGLNDRIGSINLFTDYLVETNQFDDNFQGVSATEARSFFITGAVPRAMATRNEEQQARVAPLAGQIESFRTMLDTQRTESEQLANTEINQRTEDNTPPPTGELQTRVRTMAENVGVSWDVVNRLVRKESNWDITADSGSSQGLFQINAPNAGSMTWQENAQEGLRRWVDAGEVAQRNLGRAPTPGDQYVAYQQGPGGGAALLNPANASKLAVDVLRPLYRDLATARSAIVGNGGNLNMTAAQFAQHIRDYFNS